MPWEAAGQLWEVDQAWEEIWEVDLLWEEDQVWEEVWEEVGQGVFGSPFTAAVYHKHKLYAGK